MEGSLDRILVESRLMQRRVQRPKERCTSKLRSSFSCDGPAFEHWIPAPREALEAANTRDGAHDTRVGAQPDVSDKVFQRCDMATTPPTSQPRHAAPLAQGENVTTAGSGRAADLRFLTSSFEARQLPDPGQRRPVSSVQGGFRELRLLLLHQLDRRECLTSHVG